MKKDFKKIIIEKQKKNKEKFEDFKKFAFKGNIIDLSVGVIIGTAFTKIVTSFSNDIIVPLISLVTKKIDFENLFISLNGIKYDTLALAKASGAATINYGIFLTTITNFLITALLIFITIKQLDKLRFKKHIEKEEHELKTTKKCIYCKTDIPIEATRCPNCTSDISQESY